MIDDAVTILRAGGLVAFPTETVYGLGADATNHAAVRRIFAVKGRPGTNPLIVHVADVARARRYAAHWPEAAEALAKRFWPGPLTLVLPKHDSIVDEATAGRRTVGLRAPDHALTLELLRAFDGPLAGPSANRSNRVSPTTAAHVQKELGGDVDLILDGGPCRVGIESTVLDLARKPGERPAILRPGGISREQIEAAIGPVDVFAGALSDTAPAPGPGMQPVHYAPRASAFRFDPAQRGLVEDWCARHTESRWAGLALDRRPDSRWIEMPDDPERYAQHLYAVLHTLDAQDLSLIWIEMPPPAPAWTAVRDRLKRATRPLST